MKLIISAAFLVLLTPAQAETTVCEGTTCTVVSGGAARKMSGEEVARHFREKSLRHVSDVECTYAVAPQRCEEAKRALEGSFYH